MRLAHARRLSPVSGRFIQHEQRCPRTYVSVRVRVVYTFLLLLFGGRAVGRSVVYIISDNFLRAYTPPVYHRAPPPLRCRTARAHRTAVTAPGAQRQPALTNVSLPEVFFV